MYSEGRRVGARNGWFQIMGDPGPNLIEVTEDCGWDFDLKVW